LWHNIKNRKVADICLIRKFYAKWSAKKDSAHTVSLRTPLTSKFKNFQIRLVLFAWHSYNGHHRVHALKYQGVAMADGMIVSLAGPFVGRNHDMHMFHESKIVEHLNNLNYDGHAEALYIFGDMGYVSSNRVITPFEGLNLTRAQKKFNLEMSRCREVIEWS
jgi:hypothetical protein